MKTICPTCDAVFSIPTDSPRGVVHCPKCGHRIASVVQPGVTAKAPAPDRIARGLSVFTAVCWLCIIANLLLAGWLASERKTTEAITIAAAVFPFAMFWASVSMVVSALEQIAENTRPKK